MIHQSCSNLILNYSDAITLSSPRYRVDIKFHFTLHRITLIRVFLVYYMHRLEENRDAFRCRENDHENVTISTFQPHGEAEVYNIPLVLGNQKSRFAERKSFIVIRRNVEWNWMCVSAFESRITFLHLHVCNTKECLAFYLYLHILTGIWTPFLVVVFIKPYN